MKRIQIIIDGVGLTVRELSWENAYADLFRTSETFTLSVSQYP